LLKNDSLADLARDVDERLGDSDEDVGSDLAGGDFGFEDFEDSEDDHYFKAAAKVDAATLVRREKAKITKYSEDASKCGAIFTPLVFETSGRFSLDVLLFLRKIAKAKADSDKLCFDSKSRATAYLFRNMVNRLSVCLQRANADLVVEAQKRAILADSYV